MSTGILRTSNRHDETQGLEYFAVPMMAIMDCSVLLHVHVGDDSIKRSLLFWEPDDSGGTWDVHSTDGLGVFTSYEFFYSLEELCAYMTNCDHKKAQALMNVFV